MKTKRTVTALLCTALLFSCVFTSFAAGDSIDVRLNGDPVSLSSSPVILSQDLDQGLYVPMLSFCDMMGANVTKWDANAKTALAVFRDFALDASAGSTCLTANGRCFYVENGCVQQGEDLLVPVSALASALDADYRYDSAEGILYITTGTGRIESGSDYYDQEDLYWLAHIIQAEAGSESFLGKVAVGNVVMNRVRSGSFPSTVYDVVWDNSCGVQFSPTIDGSIYNTPSADSYTAAKLALDGAAPVENCLFFASIKNCWAAYNRSYFTTIGHHDFYR